MPGYGIPWSRVKEFGKKRAFSANWSSVIALRLCILKLEEKKEPGASQHLAEMGSREPYCTGTRNPSPTTPISPAGL
jgi:hypothetical protein